MASPGPARAEKLRAYEHGVRPIGGQQSREHLGEDAAGPHARAVDFDLPAAHHARLDEGLELLAVAGIANRLVIELLYRAQERLRQGRRAAGSLKSLHNSEGGEVEQFELGHRIDFDDLPAAHDLGALDVLVDQALDGEDDLVIEGGARVE